MGTFELDVGSGRFRPSRRWVEMIGCQPEEVGETQDAWIARVDARDRAGLELELMTVREGLAAAFEAEYRIRHSDGSLRFMRARGASERGTIAGYQEDLTARRQTAEERGRSEAGGSALLDALPDAIAVHRAGRLRFVNRRMAELLGAPREELVGLLLLEVIHADDRRLVADEVMRLRHEGEVGPPAPSVEVRLLARSGGQVLVELASSPLTFDGEPAILAIARDGDPRRKLHARLASSERMASLGALIAGVAHEINNPLVAIGANLQLMVENLPLLGERVRALRARLGELLGEEAAAALVGTIGSPLDSATFDGLLGQVNDAYEGALRVQAIVGDLRQFTGTTLEHRPVDLAQVVEMALRLAGHDLKYRARITRRFEAVPKVMGDEGRLGQLVLNLLANAAQAIEAGDGNDHEVTVTLRAGAGNGPPPTDRGAAGPVGVILEVEDSGSGIPAEHLPRLFQPFFTTRPPGAGSGLGLSTCRNIVESLGGRIEVHSDGKRGTRVQVRLPAAVSQHEPPPAIVVEEVAGEPAGPSAPRPGDAHQRILLIDDEPAVARALRRDLARHWEVVVCYGGREAIELLGRDHDFALVLCELTMAEVSGQDVFVWASQELPDLAGRFVFLTGGATHPRAAAFLDEVENLVIDKPVDIAHLRAIVRHLLMVARSAGKNGTSKAVASERRVGPRFPGRDLHGILPAPAPFRLLAVVDYSISGMRLAANEPWTTPGSDPLISLTLRRSDGTDRVQADVELVRTIATDRGTDLCMRIVAMDSSSQRTYQGWIAQASAS
ncbi:MAG: PAS domain S-box protein [Myxococcales bacterium]|nr:PAS domain S-box protein [Myxococcales bacterium]